MWALNNNCNFVIFKIIFKFFWLASSNIVFVSVDNIFIYLSEWNLSNLTGIRVWSERDVTWGGWKYLKSPKGLEALHSFLARSVFARCALAQNIYLALDAPLNACPYVDPRAIINGALGLSGTHWNSAPVNKMVFIQVKVNKIVARGEISQLSTVAETHGRGYKFNCKWINVNWIRSDG